MRGKLHQHFVAFVKHWITPADAGKTLVFLDFRRNLEDHPRGCGENKAAKSIFAAANGSPPRMRGKLCAVCVKLSLPGITPADAGKTDSCNISYGAAWDHPRGCGENFAAFLRAARTLGSPPRMRGKLANAELIKLAVRITPADAGKTL